MGKLFEIKHKFSAEILFSLECKSLKICVEAFVKTGLPLRGADLRGADGEKIIINLTPLQILGLYWDILIFDSHMKIGCEFHAIKDWSEFSDTRIKEMDTNALKFWKANKEFLMLFCKLNGRN